MALEYIYDAIRATAGEDIGISATIVDDVGNPVESGCGLMLHNTDGSVIGKIDGYYISEGLWQFTIPASMTAGLYGRYYYCVCENDTTMCFQTPIYFK